MWHNISFHLSYIVKEVLICEYIQPKVPIAMYADVHSTCSKSFATISKCLLSSQVPGIILILLCDRTGALFYFIKWYIKNLTLAQKVPLFSWCKQNIETCYYTLSCQYHPPYSGQGWLHFCFAFIIIQTYISQNAFPPCPYKDLWCHNSPKIHCFC